MNGQNGHKISKESGGQTPQLRALYPAIWVKALVFKHLCSTHSQQVEGRISRGHHRLNIIIVQILLVAIN